MNNNIKAVLDSALVGKNRKKMKTKKNEKETCTYYVQEKIGGWRQNAIFNGTLQECEAYMSDHHCSNGNWSIVCEDDYEVDYL